MNLKQIVTNLTMFGFPISHIIQLKKITATEGKEDLSIWTFILFIVANMSAFIYTTEGFSPPNIMNFIIPSLIEVMLIYYIMKREKYNKIVISTSTLLCIVIIILGITSSVYEMPFNKYAGYIPSIVMPLSVIMELYTLYSDKNPKIDIYSIISWFLVLISLIGCYILAGRYKSFESIMSFLIPSIITLFVVGKVIFEYIVENKKKKKK